RPRQNTAEEDKTGEATLTNSTMRSVPVDDNAEDAHGLGEVLDGLRLACTGGASRAGAVAQVEGARDGQPAAVSEGRDDETSRHSHVLVPVQEARVGL